MKTTIHKNLPLGIWSVGNPVIHCTTVVATGVSFPDMRNCTTKKWIAFKNGGPRKVFAKAKADNVYGFNGIDCVAFIEGNAGYVQPFEHIVNVLCTNARTPGFETRHLLNEMQHHDMDPVRIRFNPTKGDQYFWADDRPSEALLYADLILFAPDGNAYGFRGAS